MNPLVKIAASNNTNVTAIFHGPDAYVTPAWYPSKKETGKVVPTWNYAVVHAQGTLKLIEDSQWLRSHVAQMTNIHEPTYQSNWKLDDAPEDYAQMMLRAIVGIEIDVQNLVGKFKLSQNRPPEDYAAVVPLTVNKTEIATAIQKARRIAIAKPDLAPYGKAAVEHLKAEGLWDLAKDKIVYGDNIGVATTYVVTGAADIGFTALSLAKATEVAKDTRYVLVNAALHAPIKQRMVLIKGASLDVQALYQFMQVCTRRLFHQTQ